jgi:hypothetical protein
VKNGTPDEISLVTIPLRLIVDVLTSKRGAAEMRRGAARGAEVASAARKGGEKAPDGSSSSSSSSASSAAKIVRHWGQQVSRRCGCVVRMECRVDAGSDRVVSSEYAARRVVVLLGGGEGGRPVLTARGRPQLTDCDCRALHDLASTAAAHHLLLGGREGWTRLRREASGGFRGNRSSVAFRHAALRRRGLCPVRAGGCFDVVEEAVTAMLLGRMPAPRREPSSWHEVLMRDLQVPDGAVEIEGGGGERIIMPVELASTASSPFWTPVNMDRREEEEERPRWSSMQDVIDENEEEALRLQQESVRKGERPRVTDWVSYVDYLHHQQQQQQQQEDVSA